MSFPKIGIAGLAWLAPGLMLMAALGCGGGLAFRLGYLAGLAHYSASLYWLLFIPFPVGAVAGWLALSAYLALYPAIWVWCCWRLYPTKFSQARPPSGRWALAEEYVATPVIHRGLWIFGCAVVWVALDVAVGRLLTGFPWNFLGVSQFQILPLAQLASITGVSGLTFLMVWFSVALLSAGLAVVTRPTHGKAWLGDLMLPLSAVVGVTAFGVWKITNVPAISRTITAALVQPSIPQTLIWDPKENTNRFQQLLRLSERALEAKPDILIWPEAAVPNVLRYEPDTLEAVTKLASEHQVWLIIGADDAVPRPGEAGPQTFDYFNSSFLISPEGKIEDTYRKRRLVIFGEYVPLARWLPFLKHFTPIGEGFKAGAQTKPFHLAPLKVKTSILICFEDTFPHLARASVEGDVDFLLNLTNNGWFGESAAQWQHAANAVFRAVESGLPLVRCANNGLSCWVDSLGRIHDAYFPNSRNIYEAGFKIIRVPLLAEGELRQPTFYWKHGDWFGWGCVGLALVMVFRRYFVESR